MKKKLLVVALATTLVLSVTACGDKKDSTSSTTATSEVATSSGTESGKVEEPTTTDVPVVSTDNTTESASTEEATTTPSTDDKQTISELFNVLDGHQGEVCNSVMTLKMTIKGQNPADETQKIEETINATIKVKGDNETAYMEMETTMSNVPDVQKSISYVENTAEGVYGYSSSDGTTWVKEKTEAIDITKFGTGATEKMIENAKLEEMGNNYIVSGTTDLTELTKSISESLLANAEQYTGGTGNAVVEFSFIFDKETKEYISATYSIDFEMPAEYKDILEIPEYTLTVQNNGFSDEKVVVPEEIKANAKTSAELINETVDTTEQ